MTKVNGAPPVSNETVMYPRGDMQEKEYEDLSLISVKYLMKLVGLWVTRNSSEEMLKNISCTYVLLVFIYLMYLIGLDVYYAWGDVSDCVFAFTNLGVFLTTAFKLSMVSIFRKEFMEIIWYAKEHLWRCDYDSQELIYVAECRLLCNTFLIVSYFIVPGSVCGFIVIPVMSYIGTNKSDRVLPFREIVDIVETPCYELVFVIQVFCVIVIAMSYVSFDMFLTVLNMHVVCRFRILQYRLLNVWKPVNEKISVTCYVDHCHNQLRRCVQQHQMLIEYCNKVEKMYSVMNCLHLVINGILFSLDCYQVILTDKPFIQKTLGIGHLSGSYMQIVILMYSCHCLIEESMNIGTTMYSGSWLNLPMSKMGKTLRTNVKIIMIRSLQPCCLTAGGFSPLTLETATALMTTTFSYFTLLRQTSS